MKSIGTLILAAALGACGGSDNMTTAPYIWGGTVTVTAGSGTCTPATAVPVTYSATGVSPANVSVPVGGCVEFRNTDTVAHDPESNPHPTHTQCPWLNSYVPPALPVPIQAGLSRTTDPATSAMVCGFHDHLNPPPVGGYGY